MACFFDIPDDLLDLTVGNQRLSAEKLNIADALGKAAVNDVQDASDVRDADVR